MSGSIDLLDNFGIIGWATNKNKTEGSRIVVNVNGKPAQIFLANEYREDLKNAGLADGLCSFRKNFSPPLAVFEDCDVSVVNEVTGETLYSAKLQAAISKNYGYPFVLPKNVAASSPVDIKLDKKICTINGFATFPVDGTLQVEAVGDVAKIISFDQQIQTPHSLKKCGLKVSHYTLVVELSDTIAMSTYYIYPDNYKPQKDKWAFCLTIPSLKMFKSNLPELESMERVSGKGVNPDMFVALGMTTSRKLADLFEAYAGKPLNKAKAVLDWGAGAGRLAKPMMSLLAPDVPFTCVDVDGENVARSAKLLPKAKWMEVPFYPPTDLPENTFEFVYGISVFTHLTEVAQDLWLKELNRITVKGAIVAVSANTEFAALLFGETNPVFMEDLVLHGISDRTTDANLGPKLKDKNYYKSTYHVESYIKERWSSAFEVLNIARGADVHVQDLVILRKR